MKIILSISLPLDFWLIWIVQRLKEQKEAEEKKKQQDLLNYVGFMDNSRMKSNKEVDLADLEDDFM